MLWSLRRKLGWRGGKFDLANHESASGATTARLAEDRLADELVAALGSAASAVSVVAVRHDSAVVVCVSGEVDASTISGWRRLLSAAGEVACAPGLLVIDTSDMEFMAACAIAALAEESRRCRQRGIALRLVCHQAVVGRVVVATGLQSDLVISTTLADALS